MLTDMICWDHNHQSYPWSLLGDCVNLIVQGPSHWAMLPIECYIQGENTNKIYFCISTWFIHNNGVLIIEASSEWIFLGVFTVLAWVVRRCIILTARYITIQWIAWFVFLSLIHWIVIYLADSVLQILKNWALDYDGFSVQSDYI